MMRLSTRLVGAALAVATCAVALPAPAQAWWARGGYWGRRVVVLPPPVFVAPPRVVYLPPPGPVWVPPHYNRYGLWVRGRWA